MIKVLEIISDTNIGGAGVLLHSRLKHSDKENFNTVVLLPKHSKLKKRMVDDGICCIEMESCSDNSFDIKGISEIISIIKEYRPDIVNTHACLSARIAAAICRVPVRVYTRHCDFPASKILKNSFVRNVSGMFNECLSTHMIAVAYAAKRNLTEMGVSESKIKVIINGVEGILPISENKKNVIKESLGFSDNDIIVGICARLEKYKDHKCFLNAAEYICRSSDRYNFLIIGDGNLRNELEKMAKDLKIFERVRFVGFVEDVTPYLNILSIQVNCSVGTETSSLALSEGMSLGLPSVVSDFGGNPYMIKHGQNGFVYKRGDHIELAMRIIEIMESRELYKQMSTNAYNRFLKELNIKNTVRKTENLYIKAYNCKKNRIV